MAAMALKIYVYVLIFYFGCASSAFAETVNDLLNQQYKNQTLALRYPFSHGELKFDSSGQPLTKPTDRWLVYGGIYIRDIKLSRDSLVLQGPRIAFPGSSEKGMPTLVLQKKVKVHIHLDRSLSTLTEAQDLLGRIFFLDQNDLSRARPEYRRSDYRPKDAAAPVELSSFGKDGLKRPRAVYTPEPDFSEEARHARYQGIVVMHIVVDTSGNVSDIRIDRALGRGLDENAVDAVKKWKFSPATRDGQPVSVAMAIEISFNLR
ncbi:MAG TPA: energy transducer TonB [Candidatus Angelobacter sp.]|nr:energy transducer TonB [Candidatus Angelobacter sp.]